MEPSSDPRTEPVLGDGHYTVVFAGTGDRTLEVNVSRYARPVQATTVHVASGRSS